MASVLVNEGLPGGVMDITMKAVHTWVFVILTLTSTISGKPLISRNSEPIRANLCDKLMSSSSVVNCQFANV